MNKMLRLQAEARARGLDLTTLPQEEYRRLAVETRTLGELAADGSRLLAAKAGELAGVRVPLKVLGEREEACRTCRHLVPLGGGQSACEVCTCSGRDLDLKRRTPWESCPLPEPRWEAADAC